MELLARRVLGVLGSVGLIVCALAATAGGAAAQLSANSMWGLPSGAYAGRAPVGWVLVVHGGGWRLVGPAVVAATEPEAAFFREHGWGTYNIDYRPGYRSLDDVISAYDALRQRAGPRAQVCAWGGSAGGQLVLMLAGLRRSLRCAITEGAPTDFLTYPNEPAWAPTGISPMTGPLWVYHTMILASFGPDHLRWWSPVRLAPRIHAHLLLGASTLDQLVPQDQMRDMRAAAPQHTTTMLLPGGTAPFMHAGVSPSALKNWEHAELALLSSTGRSA